jgi:hypothetical protein
MKRIIGTTLLVALATTAFADTAATEQKSEFTIEVQPYKAMSKEDQKTFKAFNWEEKKQFRAAQRELASENSPYYAAPRQVVGINYLNVMLGVPSLYYEKHYDRQKAIRVDVFGGNTRASGIDANVIGGSVTYKKTFSPYGMFWRAGVSAIQTTTKLSSGTTFMPVLALGDELLWESANVLFGYELGYGVAGGSNIFSFYTGYSF